MSGPTQFPMPGLELKPTEALKRGEASLKQCANCGTLVYVPGKRALGACPACGGGEWWRQDLPVGPFREGQSE